MNYDDSEKALARGTPVRGFKCLLCGRPMWDAGKQWECRCGFFYKPLVPGSIPKKYRNDLKEIKRMCMTGRGENLGKEKKCQIEVSGRAEYCPRCLAKRRNALRRLANTGLKAHSLASSPIGAEPLTKANITSGYGSSGTAPSGNLNLDIKEPVA